MQFGLYAPVPHVTAGSKEIEQSIAGALSPLPPSEVDPAFALAREVLCAADRAGFQALVADVSLGKAGIVLGLECSRLARNNAAGKGSWSCAR